MSRTYIQLARNGDIISILPLLYADAQQGERPRLIVHRDYGSLLDGVSYVEPVIFDGEPFDIAGAVEQAKAINGEWVSTQVNGPTEMVREFVYKPAGLEHAATTSFVKEQWRVAGRLKDWDACLPLVFDKRDAAREAALVAKHMPKKGKTILVHADGISSPFPYKALLLELVKHPGFSVVDLGQVKAERLYDLLALYERAHCLVAIDSAPLHLAWACPQLPVFAFANDKPVLWSGSSWRPNFEWYCRYGDFVDRCVEMVEAIRALKRRVESGGQLIHHVWNGLTSVERKAPDDIWHLLPITRGMVGRLGPEKERDTPYLKDCLRMGLQRAGAKGLLCVTRPDTILIRDITNTLAAKQPCYAYRLAEKGEHFEFSPVVDLLCADGLFWRGLLDQIPDLLFGSDYYWSHALWALFNKAGARDVTGIVSRVATAPKAKQAPTAATTHNAPLVKKLLADHGIVSRYPKVADQIETAPLDTTKLAPFGYNPSIIEHEGFLLLAYRRHYDETAATEIRLAQVEPSGAVVSDRALSLDTKAAEDPHFFRLDGKIHFSLVASAVPHGFNSVVRYTELLNGKPQSIVTPKIGKNDFSRMEKNWVFFDALGLHCIYECAPEHVVYRVDGEKVIGEYRTPGPHWPWGKIRGGTAPIEYDGAWLRFFHSPLDNDFASYTRRYFVGAYLMEPKPPFKVLRVSCKPILYGSEVDTVKVSQRPFHHKRNVVFPGGAVARGDHFLLSVGVNDSSILLCKIREKDLNL